ncbi:uncharacterized protein KRP23_4194 [Phytophthora ramorum]|uniref:uncharacterized protein n=1 Tax=Phytophthora ramorum TaxID=164328 RepID=UPI0030B5B764|nr:hypothetical protein KRP23_4194 [Phytophthora ramorum]
MAKAVQQRVLRTDKKDITAVCEEHPGWKRRTVAHYYNLYERGERLQPRCGIVALVEQACQPALLPAPVMQDTCPSARARGVASVPGMLKTPTPTPRTRSCTTLDWPPDQGVRWTSATCP